MHRFQVYKRCRTGSLIHITSVMATCLSDAIEKQIEQYREYKANRTAFLRAYRVTGVTLCVGEDIRSNLPNHITDRIRNKGIRTNFKGSLYPYKSNNGKSI